MTELKRQRVRDPLHDLIEFDEGNAFESMLWRVVQTAAFQRLRRIKQLGFSELVYPGATHSRFVHSLGVFHTARQLMRIVERYAPRTPAEEIQREAALAASLVHDVGHGPFSHAFESIGKRFNWRLVENHEVQSEQLILATGQGSIGDILNGYRPRFADTVAEVLRRGPETVYGSIVSSQFDADRLDYIRRDRLMTGTRLARVDFEWLLANLEIGELPQLDPAVEPGKPPSSGMARRKTLVLGPKAIYAAEAFVVGLFQMYPTVYLHKATRGAEKIAQFVLEKIAACSVADGDLGSIGLPERHPLVDFFRDANSSEKLSRLDDPTVVGAFGMLRDSPDRQIADFVDRLMTRRLFKSIDLLFLAESRLPPRTDDDSHESVLLKFRKRVELKIEDWSRSGNRSGRILLDYAKRSPYRNLNEETSANHIWIRDGSNLVPLGKRSETVKAIGTFFAFRAYVDDSDDEARRFVTECVTDAVKGDAI